MFAFFSQNEEKYERSMNELLTSPFYMVFALFIHYLWIWKNKIVNYCLYNISKKYCLVNNEYFVFPVPLIHKEDFMILKPKDKELSKRLNKAFEDMIEDFDIDIRLKNIPLEEILKRFSTEDRLKGVPNEDRLKGVPNEDRLKGVPNKDRLKGVPNEDRLKGVPNEDRLKGVPIEEIKKYIESLNEDNE